MQLLQILLERAEPGGQYKDIFKYADDEDVYVSFTNLAYKSGLNPQSTFDTPLGIYCYPLKASMKIYGSDADDNNFPYAADRDYVNVLRSRDNISVLHSDEYSESDYDRDVEKLKTWAQTHQNHKIADVILTRLSEFHENAKGAARVTDKPMGWIWYIMYKISNNVKGAKSPVVWNYILQNILNYDLVVDTKYGIVHDNEPCQALFLSNRGYRLIDVISNKQPRSTLRGYMRRFSTVLTAAVKSNREDMFKKTLDTMNSFFERVGIGRGPGMTDVGVNTIAMLSVYEPDNNRAYEFIKRFIKWMGVNEVTSWNDSIIHDRLGHDKRQLVAKALIVLIDDIDSRHLRNIMRTYDIPYSILLRRFGKNDMSDAIRHQSPVEFLKSLNNPNNIISTVQSLGKDEFSKLLKYWMVDSNSAREQISVLKLIYKLDLEGGGERLRGDKKIRSILDITDESFHAALANLISDDTWTFLYSILLPAGASLKSMEVYLTRLLSLYSRLKSYWSVPSAQMVLMETALYSSGTYDQRREYIAMVLSLLYRRGVIRPRPEKLGTSLYSLFRRPEYSDYTWDMSKL